jgi:hypothetical protein
MGVPGRLPARRGTGLPGDFHHRHAASSLVFDAHINHFDAEAQKPLWYKTAKIVFSLPVRTFGWYNKIVGPTNLDERS